MCKTFPCFGASKQRRDSLIVKIRLKRPWKVQPGEFIYLRLLTMRCGSIFQRQPSVIAWWDTRDKSDDNSRIAPLVCSSVRGGDEGGRGGVGVQWNLTYSARCLALSRADCSMRLSRSSCPSRCLALLHADCCFLRLISALQSIDKSTTTI